LSNRRQQSRLLRAIHDFAEKAGIQLDSDLKPTTLPNHKPYTLRSLPITGKARSLLRKRLISGAHLSPEAAFYASAPHLKLINTTAILDSGATKHFVSQELQPLLTNVRRMPATMYNANGVRTDLTMGGDLKITLHDEQGQTIDTLPLPEVSIIPGATFNLLSLTQLCKDGASFHLAHEGSFLQYHNHRFKLDLQRGLITIDLSKPLQATSKADDDHFANVADTHSPIDPNDEHIAHHACLSAAAPLHVWHEKLGHASTKRISHLSDSGSALGMNITGKTTHNAKCTCEACMKTNNISVAVPSTRQFADTVPRRGQIITTDVLGPFPQSVEGYRYAISFTDEYSRYSVVYLLKTKSEAAATIDALATLYRSLNLVISEIRHDMGGEFGGTTKETIGRGGPTLLPSPHLHAEIYTNEFKSACRRNNIISVSMPAYKPQLHGIAERWNKTVMAMANSMMYAAKISPILWCSAITHANNVRNHLPTRSRGGLTPQELFTNRRPRYENFRIWGSYCYKKLPVCRKLPGIAVRKRLIYLGDSPDGIGFKCFDPIDYKFTTEFELIFDESSVAKRSHLLEAFDNRRKIIGNNNIVDNIPIIADLDHSQTDERTVYELYNNNAEQPAQPTPNIAQNPNQTIVHEPAMDTNQWNDDDSEFDHQESPSEVSRISGSSNADTTNTAAGDHRNLRSLPKRAATRNTPINQFQEDKQFFSTNPTSDNRPNNATAHRTKINGIRSVNTEEIHYPSTTSLARGKRQIRGNAERNLRPVTETCDIDDAETIFTEEDFISSTNPLSNEPISTIRSPYRNTSFNESGTDFEIQQDAAAEANGPLTTQYLEHELPLHEYDLTPGQLKCPLRYLPKKAVQEEHPLFKTFLKLAEQENLPIEIDQTNPKSGDSAARYNLYKHATTVLDFFNICKQNHLPKAAGDFKNDFYRGYITFPHNTQQRSENNHTACIVLSSTQEHDPADITSLLNPTQSAFHELVQSLWPHDPYQTTEEINQRNLDSLKTVLSLLAESVTALPTTPEPTSYAKAIHPDNPEREEWLAAIKRELDTLVERNTWSYIDRHLIPKGRRPIRCKYVFKRKFNKDGSIQYKARLVACGVTQRAGLDYSSDELYASVCSYSSMRFLMSLATQKRMLLYQTDIQGAYLESYLDDEIYMHVPDGIDNPNKLCRLIRGLYGCKQSGWAWSECFKEFMTADPTYNMNFKPMTGEPNLYRRAFILQGQKEEVIVGQYVDDCLVAASSQAALDWYMSNLKLRFPVNPKSSGFISKENPGLLLSMQVEYDRDEGILNFHQKRAIEALATKFALNETHPILLPIKPDHDLPKLLAPEDPTYPTTFLSMIGSCLHICQVSRPDCSFAVGILARHAATPGIEHMTAAQDLIRYMYHTRNYCIQYKSTESPISNQPYVFERSSHPSDAPIEDWKEDLSTNYKLAIPPRTIEERLEQGHTPTPHANHPLTYIDANLGGDRLTRKSTSGLVVMMNGGPIAWSSRLQKLCAQSSAEAEIIAVVDSVKEALHIKLLCEECEIRPPNIPLEIQEDNNACIHLAHNLRGSQQAKHYELRLRFLNEHVLENNIEFSRVDTTQQLADGFTKPLSLPNFRIFRNWMLHNPDP